MYVSATQLTAAVPASLIAAAGTASVTVTTVGGTSTATTFTINQVAQTITFANPGPLAYGVGSITLSATASSGLPVSFAVTSASPVNIGTVRGSTLTITGAGAVTVQAIQGGNSVYAAASPVSDVILVNPAPLQAACNNQAVALGGAIPALTGTLTGVVSGDGITESCTTAAVTGSPVGNYPINTRLNDPNSKLSNYDISVTNGTLVVYNTPLPLPVLLSPGSATAGGAGFTLTVFGPNFTSNSVVLWNGAVRTTTYVSSTEVTAVVLASDIATEGTNLITVANLAPNAGTSSAMPFVVMNATPVATISAASVLDAANGSGTYVVALTGTDFVSSSTVQWNGASLTTTYVSPRQVSAVITASDFTSLPATVTVVNPAGTSAGFELQ